MYEVFTTDGGPASVPRLFTHHDSHPIVLHHILTRDMGVDWLVWDYSALWDEIKKTYGVLISNLNRCKVQALRTLQANELFWNNWEVATPVIRALNNKMPDFYIFQPPTAIQLYAAVDMINDIRKLSYNQEVKNLMVAILLNEGLLYAPEPLSFLQEGLDRKHYRCNTCGQVATDYKHKRCDACGSSDLFHYKKTDEAVITEIKEFVNKILHDEDLPIYEDVKGINAAKWKVAKNYTKSLHQRLNNQMRFV